MRTSTFLWGLIVTATGTLAMLRGAGLTLSLTSVVIALLLLFALALTAAAFAPARQEQTTPPLPNRDGDTIVMEGGATEAR